MNKYISSPTEFLKEDNSYLVVPHKTSNIFSKAFWSHMEDKSSTAASTTGNQREAYEHGVKIGWDLAVRHAETVGKNPHPSYMSKQDANDIMSIMTALGVQFEYMMQPPSWMHALVDVKSTGLHPGLNITKNIKAIEGILGDNEEIVLSYLRKAYINSCKEILKNYNYDN